MSERQPLLLSLTTYEVIGAAVVRLSGSATQEVYSRTASLRGTVERYNPEHGWHEVVTYSVEIDAVESEDDLEGPFQAAYDNARERAKWVVGHG